MNRSHFRVAAIAPVVLISLAGCGDGDDESAMTTASPMETASAATTTEPPATDPPSTTTEPPTTTSTTEPATTTTEATTTTTTTEPPTTTTTEPLATYGDILAGYPAVSPCTTEATVIAGAAEPPWTVELSGGTWVGIEGGTFFGITLGASEALFPCWGMLLTTDIALDLPGLGEVPPGSTLTIAAGSDAAAVQPTKVEGFTVTAAGGAPGLAITVGPTELEWSPSDGIEFVVIEPPTFGEASEARLNCCRG